MRIVAIVIGVVLLLFGLATIFLPLPTGILSVVVGLAILTGASPHTRKALRWLRRRVSPFDKAIHQAEKVLPPALSDPLKSSDPCEDDDEEEDERDEDEEEDDTPPVQPLPKAPPLFVGRTLARPTYSAPARSVFSRRR